MRTLALDASTRCTGWSVMEDGKLTLFGKIDERSSKDGLEERTGRMTHQITELIQRYAPDKIYLEDTAKMANMSTYKDLCWLAGGIRYYCYEHRYTLEMIMPAAWRKYVHIQENGVKRAELKRRAIELCKEQFGVEASEDESEAILINLAMYYRDDVWT